MSPNSAISSTTTFMLIANWRYAEKSELWRFSFVSVWSTGFNAASNVDAAAITPQRAADAGYLVHMTHPATPLAPEPTTMVTSSQKAILLKRLSLYP
jgi:hypothetical protein